jgi:hypothetical protein
VAFDADDLLGQVVADIGGNADLKNTARCNSGFIFSGNSDPDLLFTVKSREMLPRGKAQYHWPP